MVGGRVEGGVQHHRAGDVLDGEVAGDLQLALAGGFDAGALEGRGRELEGVEEVGAQQVLVEVVGETVHPGQGQRDLHARGGHVVRVVDQGAVDVAEVEIGRAHV